MPELSTEVIYETTILPFGCQGTALPTYVKPTERVEKLLFIGGPLDGQLIPMHADGRLHDHNEVDGIETTVYRYIPSVVVFDGKKTMVYILLERIRQLDDTPRLKDHNQKQITKSDVTGYIER